MILLAHDPGRRAGYARFRNGVLLDTGRRWIHDYQNAHRAVVELPESRGGNTVASTDDLIALAFRAGQFAGRFTHCDTVKPSAWKGSVPKTIHHKRIKAKLSPEELALLKGVSADVLDAVGLGLWWLESKGLR